MFLKESTNRRGTKVLKIGFHKQTPGKLPCLAEKALQREARGHLPAAGLAGGRRAWVLEDFAIKILFKMPPIEALMSDLQVERALRLHECILCQGLCWPLQGVHP